MIESEIDIFKCVNEVDSHVNEAYIYTCYNYINQIGKK